MGSKNIFFVNSIILLCIVISGCSFSETSSPQVYLINGAGLLVIDTEEIPFQLNSDTKIEVTPEVDFSQKISQDAVILNFAEIHQIGDQFNVKIRSQDRTFTLEMKVRAPCLTYLSDVIVAPEIWQICGQENLKLTETGGRIVDYAVAKNGDWVAYAVQNEIKGTDIWWMGRNGEEKEKVYSCGAEVCDQLAVNSQGSRIAFISSASGGSLFLLQIGKKAPILIENGSIINVDFSPDDVYLRYFESTKGVIRVFKLNSMELITSLESDSDLIGSWKIDSSGFLYGQYEYSGRITGVTLHEIDLLNDQQTLIMNGTESYSYLYQPTYKNEDQLFVLARVGFNGNRKQIWQINKNKWEIIEITGDYQFNHSFLAWNQIEEKLAFQKFDPSKSNSLPEVWIWKKSSGNFQMVAQNAAHPEWVY